MKSISSVVLSFDYESKTVAIFYQDLPDSLVTLSVQIVSRPPSWIVILAPDSLGSDQDGWHGRRSTPPAGRSAGRSAGINSQKKKARPISNHLDQKSLVNKGFIIWLSGKFFLRDKAGSPEWARWLHLTCSCSQSQRAIWFILHAQGATILDKMDEKLRPTPPPHFNDGKNGAFSL